MNVTTDRLKKAIKSAKPLPLLILTIISATICIFALRSNNEHMNQLRNQVYQADKNGGNVDAALQTLAKYVTTHMNTNLSSGPNAVYPPIQLTYSYNRITTNQAQTLEQQNSALYTKAEDYCQAVVPNGFSGRYRIPCIEQYISSHGLQGVNIPSALYEFDFISPAWSPDLAGWSLILTVTLGIATIVSFVYHIATRKTKQKSNSSS